MGTRKRSQVGAEAVRDSRRPRDDGSMPASAAATTPRVAPTPSAHATHAATRTRRASVATPHVSRTSATPRTRAAHAQAIVAAPPHSTGAAQHGAHSPTSASAPALRPHAQGTRLGSTREQQARQQARATRVVSTAAPQFVGQPGATSRDTLTRLTPRPGPATDSGRRHFGELRAALDDGWEIVQPIFARPLWSAADDSATAFNFVLHSPHGTRLITVPQGALVERFIRDRHLSVDHAR